MHILSLVPFRCLRVSQSNKQRRVLQFGILTRVSSIMGLVGLPRTVFRRCPCKSPTLSCRLRGTFLIHGLVCPLEIRVLNCHLLGTTLRSIQPIPEFGLLNLESIQRNPRVPLLVSPCEPHLVTRSFHTLSGAKARVITLAIRSIPQGPTGCGTQSNQPLKGTAVIVRGPPRVTFSTRPALTGSRFLPAVLSLCYLRRPAPILAGIVVEVTQTQAITWVGLLRHTLVDSLSNSDLIHLPPGQKFCPGF